MSSVLLAHFACLLVYSNHINGVSEGEAIRVIIRGHLSYNGLGLRKPICGLSRSVVPSSLRPCGL